MSSLDHAGLAGMDPLGAVTFVDNHDTDNGGIGGPVVSNKMLAYAYVLTSEGYPCIFYRDYSTDPGCFKLKDKIDRLIWIHERVAAGETLQRWKDDGVFAYERLGGKHLLVGLNKDAGTTRAIMVQTGFAANQELQSLIDDHAPRLKTDDRSMVRITIPKNVDGLGYVCYGMPIEIGKFRPKPIATTQDYEGAIDLDIKPAMPGETVQVCRVFADANTDMGIRLKADDAHWTPATSIKVSVSGADGLALGSQIFDQNTNDSAFSLNVSKKQFYSVAVEAANTPDPNTSYRLRVSYRAPQNF
jgi:alpha-amylase